MTIQLKTGHSFVNITIPDDKIYDIIIGKNVSKIDHEKVAQIISKGIKTYSPEDVENKKIAIIIPDDTRLWARGDVFVPQIVKTLFDLGVSKNSIKIIIALGTHEDLEKDIFPKLAGEYCLSHVDILNSANKNQDRLVYMGETREKTPLYFTKEAVDADHIIIFGGILHHMAAGFGGGRKYILPGIAGYDSIQHNHSLAMNKDGSAHHQVRQRELVKNPINQDMVEAAHIFLKDKTCTYVAVAANGEGDIFHVDAGPLEDTFTNGCNELDRACCVQVSEKGDFILFSAGGHRTDGQLYQSTKALFNAVNIVKDGGDLLFVAECEQGVGNPTFSSMLKTFKGNPQELGKKLVEKFNMPSYVAFRVLDLLERYNVTLFSRFSKSETEELGFQYTDNIDNYIENLKGRGYIIPYAENILPVVNDI